MRDLLYQFTLKPFFFRLSPEDAHELSRKLLEFANVLPGVFSLVEEFSTYRSKRLETVVSGIKFPNPLGMAAGFDKTGELYPFLGRLGFGFVEVGTVTGEAQPGNPKPRIFRYEKDQALVNRMGFNNPGSEKLLKYLENQTKTIPRGINAGKTKLVSEENAVEDYVKTFTLTKDYLDYGVINISSPNTPGLRNFQQKDSFLNLINGIKKGLGGSFPFPMYVKLAPDLTENEFDELMELILEVGLNGVVLTNTTIDKSVLKSYKEPESGGISGQILQSRSTFLIKRAYSRLKGRIPIIGVGGIMDGPSALEKILAGADLIQIYTGYIYKGPFLPFMILEYLDKYMEKNNIDSISKAVGTGGL